MSRRHSRENRIKNGSINVYVLLILIFFILHSQPNENYSWIPSLFNKALNQYSMDIKSLTLSLSLSSFSFLSLFEATFDTTIDSLHYRKSTKNKISMYTDVTIIHLWLSFMSLQCDSQILT